MKKILFTHSYFYRFDLKQWKTRQPYPPLATLLAAAVVRKAGHLVSVYDTSFDPDTLKIEIVIAENKPDVLVILDDGFNYLTKMCLTNMSDAARKIIGFAKKLGIKVVMSSSDATDKPKKYLDAGADYIVFGEVENTLIELLDKIAEEAAHELDGIVYTNDKGEVTKNASRQIIKDLDALPFPAWDLIDIEPYRKIWIDKQGYFSLNIATTRGCPFHCNWCAKPIYGVRYTSRSAENVASEIEILVNKYSVSHFWFCDDIFGLKPGWVSQFAEELNKRKLKIKYKIQSRVDLLLKEETVEALSQSGAEIVWVGAESGSQKILDAMEKGTKIEEIHNATKLLKKKGIRVAFFLQFGYPGEEKEDIKKTIKMMRELLPDEIGISVSYPLPGTKFYENVKSQMGEKENWSDSDDLAIMFSGKFSNDYYRKLHRYVHKVFRLSRFIYALKNPRLFYKLISGLSGLRSIALVPYYIIGAIIDKVILRLLEKR